MIVPGLVSVTLRQCGIDDIVTLVADCGLRAIHWGGDVHVPAGDHAAAEHAGRRCAAEGIEIEGYGSYYRAGDTDPSTFPAIVDTARALGAERIRVWPGVRGSAETSPEARNAVTDDLRRCADRAAEHGCRIALEYHPNTLTDDLDSALALLAEAAHPAIETYWQPRPAEPTDEALRAVASLRPKLVGAHVFSWGPGGFHDRLPLWDHAAMWQGVLAEMAGDGHRRHALLEFVVDDSPELVRRDAATLLGWLE